MPAALKSPGRLVAVVALLLALALAGQVGAEALAPSTDNPTTQQTVGRAGFAYLTGLRTFAAYVLWNRLEPQFHEYYEGPLAEQEFLMPTIRAVVALNPEFVDSYYVAAWVLARKGRVDDAIELAETGVKNNPDSALLRVSQAQIVWTFDKDVKRAARIAKPALKAEWRNVADAYEGYAVMRALFREAGMKDEQRIAEQMYEKVKSLPAAQGLDDDHDHDGDGEPDH